MATVFDTLAFSRRLQQAHFSTEQSDALADAVHDAVRGSVATKADVDLSGEKLRNEMGGLRVEIETLRSTVTLHGWMLGVICTGVIALVAKAFF